MDMPELIERARRAVMDLASQRLREDHDADVSYVALDLPCTFFMLRTATSLPIVTPVARRFVWSADMSRLAQKVVDGIAAATGARRSSPEP